MYLKIVKNEFADSVDLLISALLQITTDAILPKVTSRYEVRYLCVCKDLIAVF